MRPTDLLYSAVLQAHAKTATPTGAERAEQLLRRNIVIFDLGGAHAKVSTTCYNAIIDAWARSGAEDGAIRAEAILTELMDRSGDAGSSLKPSARSFNAAILAWKKSGDPGAPERAEAVLKRMNDLYRLTGDVGVKPDTCALNSVIGCWSRSGSSKGALRAEAFLLYAEERAAAGDTTIRPDRIMYNTVVDAWAESGDIEAASRAIAVAERMGRSGAPGARPNVMTLRSLLIAHGVPCRMGRTHALGAAVGRAAAQKAEVLLSAALRSYEAKENRVDKKLIGIAFQVAVDAFREAGDSERERLLRTQRKALLA